MSTPGEAGGAAMPPTITTNDGQVPAGQDLSPAGQARQAAADAATFAEAAERNLTVTREHAEGMIAGAEQAVQEARAAAEQAEAHAAGLETQESE